MDRRLAFTLICLVFLIGSVVAMVSAMWFLDAFLSDGHTTAFVPFIAWGITFHSEGEVINISYAIIITSFVFCSVSSFALAYLMGTHEDDST